MLFYICFLLNIKSGLRKLKQEPGGSVVSKITGVTLVIPFRNEEENLRNLIEDVANLEKDGINFDVIFVNDHSEDDWQEYKNQIRERENFRVVRLFSLQMLTVGFRQNGLN